MVISPVPWLVVLGCSYLFIQDIGPGLSLYTVGAQGKIGPHTCNTNNLGGDTIYLFLVYTHLKEKKSYNTTIFIFVCNVVFKVRLKGQVLLLIDLFQSITV